MFTSTHNHPVNTPVVSANTVIHIEQETDLLQLLNEGSSSEQAQAEAALLKAMHANLFPHGSDTPHASTRLTLNDVCQYIN